MEMLTHICEWYAADPITRGLATWAVVDTIARIYVRATPSPDDDRWWARVEGAVTSVLFGRGRGKS